MSSALSWLDYSERERRKALDVIEQFQDKDTRDELGIGTIRDCLADLLFPGTSTIQTRARYFLFIPWIYIDLEEKIARSNVKGMTVSNVESRARQAEVQLMRSLPQSDGEGLIGKQAKDMLQRFPSSIYWAGLRTWGILQFDRSQEDYHRWLNQYYNDAKRKGKYKTDLEGPKERTANWHTNLPKPPADFPDGVDFTLTCDEAEYLEDRIQQCLPESLLAAMIKMRVTHTDIPYPWLHPIAPELPSQLTEILWHAHHFSEIMHGAALLYNLMLAESHKQFGKWKDHYQQAINHWWIDTQDIRHKISNTALIELWNACNSSTRHRITPGAKTFVTTWYNIVHTARNIESFTHKTSSARSLIFNREKKLKGVRARIGNAKLLAEWRGSSGAAQLNYRWKVSSRIIEDIVSAL